VTGTLPAPAHMTTVVTTEAGCGDRNLPPPPTPANPPPTEPASALVLIFLKRGREPTHRHSRRVALSRHGTRADALSPPPPPRARTPSTSPAGAPEVPGESGEFAVRTPAGEMQHPAHALSPQPPQHLRCARAVRRTRPRLPQAEEPGTRIQQPPHHIALPRHVTHNERTTPTHRRGRPHGRPPRTAATPGMTPPRHDAVLNAASATAPAPTSTHGTATA
jgi:hypothetical protein